MNLFEPVAGYLITIPKLITNISMSISFIYYPEISTYLAWIFTIFVALAIIYSPTHLKYPLFAAILVFFIPTDAENFGLPLYTFWFSALLLFLVAMWQQQEKQIIKNIFLFMGGVSSPVIVLLVPIQMFRSLVLANKKEELFSLLIAALLSIVQLSYIFNAQTHTNIPIINIDFLNTVIIKFFGFYFLRDFIFSDNLLLLGGIYIFILFILYWVYNKKDIYFYILLFMLFASIGLSVCRVDPGILHPVLARPRYFFFPFILLSWTLLYLSAKNKFFKLGIIPVIVLSIFISSKNFGREHEFLEWRRHLYVCSQETETYRIPIHFNGDKILAWGISLTPKKCQELIANDMFEFTESDKKIFLISIKNYGSSQVNKVVNAHNISINTFGVNQTSDKKSLDGFVVYGSFINGDGDRGRLVFTATKGSQILVKTGPVTKHQTLTLKDTTGKELIHKTLDKSENWSIYSFNRNLPQTFFVEITDDGSDWCEWSAVAFKMDNDQ